MTLEMAQRKDPTALDQIFKYSTYNFKYSIHWTSLGSPTNPPLMFIHGTPWSSRYWSPFALSLASRFQVFLFDNPGFGESPGGSPLEDEAGDLDASLRGQAESFAALIKHCGLEAERKPHVVAHDVGGLISLRGMLIHGLQYASLCLIDVVAVKPFGSPFFKYVASNHEVLEQIPETIFDGLLEAYIAQASFSPLGKDVMDMLKRPWLEDGTQSKKGFFRQIYQANQKDVEEVDSRYGEVGKNCKVKILWGADDEWIPRARAEKLADMVGAEELVVIEEAGHLLLIDQPGRLGVELGYWLSQVAR